MKCYIIILISLSMSSCGIGLPFDRGALQDYGRQPTDGIQTPSGALRIIIMDVGQGDAALIIAPDGETILIDAGPPGAGSGVVIPTLEQESITEIQMIIATHYHEDHIGGIPEVIAGSDHVLGTEDDFIPKGGVYDRGRPKDDPKTPLYKIYEASTAGRRFTAHPGEQIRLGDVGLAVVAQGGTLADGTSIDLGDPDDENTASVAILMEYAGFKMLFAADITGGGGDPPYNTPDLETSLTPIVGDIDILKVAHHGSDTSSNEAFLNATKPEVAIISVGDTNDYHHPHRAVIDRLLAAGVAIYQTERGWMNVDGPIVAGGNIIIDVDNDGSYAVTTE